MEQSEQQQVALFIDFENLVYGLHETFGTNFADEVEPELLFRLAEEYGQVVLANAYADWRFREINQFQADLYRLGIDLIHVFAKRHASKYKNAVDVKMAVDAIETVWTLPHVDTFVIVSGDRDFIHVLKTLRRYGKTVVGVSPAKAVSNDFAALCDRFVRYGALAHTYRQDMLANGHVADVPGDGHLDAVRRTLRQILRERPEGLKGSQIKPLLRRHLSVTFDESEYGFSRLVDLLHAIPDAVSVVHNPGGGDITVFPAGVGAGAAYTAAPAPALEMPNGDLARRAGLPRYRFVADASRRHEIIAALYNAMVEETPFKLANVFDSVLDDCEELQLSTTVLSKYQAILWQSRVFEVEANQQAIPTRERLMRLVPEVACAQDLAFRYEASIVYKLAAAAEESGHDLAPAAICGILGMEEDDEGLAYASRLLEHVSNQQNG
ncbi:MAG: NYN domain-containing protein [Anaerolineae bacterium]|nr:NYN domain-containing protein [Anaerolineae bacterium]